MLRTLIVKTNIITKQGEKIKRGFEQDLAGSRTVEWSDSLRHPTEKKLISKTKGGWGAPGRATGVPRDPHHTAKLYRGSVDTFDPPPPGTFYDDLRHRNSGALNLNK